MSELPAHVRTQLEPFLKELVERTRNDPFRVTAKVRVEYEAGPAFTGKKEVVEVMEGKFVLEGTLDQITPHDTADLVLLAYQQAKKAYGKAHQTAGENKSGRLAEAKFIDLSDEPFALEAGVKRDD